MAFLFTGDEGAPDQAGPVSRDASSPGLGAAAAAAAQAEAEAAVAAAEALSGVAAAAAAQHPAAAALQRSRQRPQRAAAAGVAAATLADQDDDLPATVKRKNGHRKQAAQVAAGDKPKATNPRQEALLSAAGKVRAGLNFACLQHVVSCVFDVSAYCGVLGDWPRHMQLQATVLFFCFSALPTTACASDIRQ